MQDHQSTIGRENFTEGQVNHNPRLTSSEIANLWSTFMQYTMISRVYSYFRQVAEDQHLKEFCTDIINRSEKRVHFAADAFQKEGIPIPMGFTDADVNLAAPPLFSDIFLIHYSKNMARVAMTLNSLCLNMSSRPDVRNFYSTVVESIIAADEHITNMMLAKGILPRPPYTTISRSVEHVHEPRFLSGFLGEKRPLLTIEVAHLYHNALGNEIGRNLLLGLRQVSRNKEVQEFYSRGIELSQHIIDKVIEVARRENIEFSFVRDTDISESTEAPFSDKMAMFMINMLNSIGTGMYGVSGAESFRHDLVAMYGKFMLEVGAFSEAGVKLMMKNDWLEEPPQFLDREELAEITH